MLSKMRTSLPVLTLACAASAVQALNLNITALGAANNASTLECWQMTTPFTISSTAGTSGSASLELGDVTNLTYTVLPAGFDGGLHNAPRAQWVIFISGLAYITLPTNSTTAAYIPGGEFGVIFAADTADVSAAGHRTQYPGVTETVALQMPVDEVPTHEVIHSGPCVDDDFVGLRGLALAS
ncbi:hypothetical protein BD289DRAFT_435236 [Coniella lustricola]|uniref:Small secreted protein n=1 Tax=Coniella lustricola TaxID=2025994 RepID=A0A2T3A6L0_9PEZI|nr:hypothetical protein BD289DRAFT_435236 [Coniella lustricola]